MRIKGYITADRFTTYLNDVMDEIEEDLYYAISGWIDSESDSQKTNLDLLAQDLLSSNSVGMIKYLDSAKIFFLHKKQILEKWTHKLGFEVRSLKRSTPLSMLAFVLIYEPSKANGQEFKKLTPKSVATYQGSTRPAQVFSSDTSGKNKNLEALIGASQNDNFRAPVVNIRPEFMNMDSNSADPNNSRGHRGFQNYENNQQGHQSQSMVFDPYNEEPVYEEEFGFGNGQNRQSRGFKGFNTTGSFSRENSRDNSNRPQKNYIHPQQQQRFNPQQQPAKKFFKPTNSFGFAQRQPYRSQFTADGSQTQRQNAPQYPNYSQIQRNQSNTRPFNTHNRVAGNAEPNPFYTDYLKKKQNQMSLSPAGRYTSHSPMNATNKLLFDDNRYPGGSQKPFNSQKNKFSTHQQQNFKENMRGQTYTSQTNSQSYSNMFARQPFGQTYTAKMRR